MKPIVKTLAAAAILGLVFAVSFLVFYKRAKRNLPKRPLILTSAVINQTLPKANLINISGKLLDDENLRRGKVVLVFMMTACEPCDQENEFLKTVVGSRKEVRFIYVIPFGNKDQSLKVAQSKYALEPLYDDGSNLAKSLEIYQVPIKIFLEDGVIKRTWLDATVSPQKQAEFKEWLNGL